MTTPADDPRVEQPEAKPTVQFPPPPPWAIELSTAVRNVANNVADMRQDVTVLMEDRPILHSRLAGVEGRMARLENPSHPPPPPLTSTGIKALIDGHPSQMDMSLQAAQAAELVKNAERDKRIEETHALAAKAAEVLAEQSDYMGMGKKGMQWLFSEKGRTAMAQAAAGLVAAYEILKHGGVIK